MGVHRIRELTDFELGWVAGLLEGEGCFSIQWGQYANGDPYPRFEVRCNMTDEDVIRRLHEVVGAGRVRGPIAKPAPSGKDGKPQWLWTLGRKAGALELVRLLQPAMGSRRSAKIQEFLDAHEEFPPREWRHGTRQGYEAHGCRCEACRRSNTERHRGLRRARGIKPFQPAIHGTRSKYVRGCRCVPCSDAAGEYERSRGGSRT